MNAQVSNFFIPIYENYLAKTKKGKPSTDLQKLADTIFHEREFVDWLRKKYKQKVTKDSYLKLCTHKNFQDFLSSFNKTKNIKENQNKKAIIEEQLTIAEKLPPITKYEYDVDIVETYFKIERLLQTVVYAPGYINKEEYLQGLRYPIENYCRIKDLPVKTIFQIKYPIIVDSTMYGFEAYLGRTLIAFDVHKIEAVLSYQKSIWKGKGLFASFVEHGVYNFVFHNSPFDNNARLSKIMQWVEKNRVFKSGKIKKKNKVGDYGKKTVSTGFFYWPYAEEKLTELYNALILHRKIDKNDLFLDSFKEHKDFPQPSIVWKVKQVQLIYLFHLIYKKEPQYNSIPVYNIPLKLFKKIKGDFDYKVSNTTYNEMVKNLDNKKKLSLGLQSIDKIFDSLNLT